MDTRFWRMSLFFCIFHIFSQTEIITFRENHAQIIYHFLQTFSRKIQKKNPREWQPLTVNAGDFRGDRINGIGFRHAGNFKILYHSRPRIIRQKAGNRIFVICKPFIIRKMRLAPGAGIEPAAFGLGNCSKMRFMYGNMPFSPSFGDKKQRKLYHFRPCFLSENDTLKPLAFRRG